MATIITSIIGTGGDYTTIQAWEDACPSNLVTSDEIWQGKVKNQEFSVTNGVVLISGMTTDSTRYIELTTDTGASFVDHADLQTNALRYNASNGAGLISNNNYFAPVRVDSGLYVRISKLQIKQSGIAHGYTSLSTAFVTLDQCIIESGGAVVCSLAGDSTYVSNSLIVGNRGSTGTALVVLTFGSDLYNCTLVAVNSAYSNAFDGSYSTPVVKNCAVFNCTAIKTGGNTPTYTSCVTDVASPPSGFTGSVAFSTSSGAYFENITAGSHDLRIKAGSALIDAGSTESTYAATSINGISRPSGSAYDVGCWEYVASVLASISLRRAFPLPILNF